MMNKFTNMNKMNHHLSLQTIKRISDHEIWRWISLFSLGICTKMWRVDMSPHWYTLSCFRANQSFCVVNNHELLL